jgi:hypothetical protein
LTPSEKTRFISGLIALIPYALLAWGVTKFDTDLSFWTALGVLLGVRLIFGIIEMVGGILAWRLHGRDLAVNNFLRVLRENKFPPRHDKREDILAYLSCIQEGFGVDGALKSTAREMEALLVMCEGMGILAGARMYSASEAALEIYSPRVNAPRSV